jgi:multiple sugar transport system permease protein/raffinose/stachyose/melibiose transport system permease protein
MTQLRRHWHGYYLSYLALLLLAIPTALPIVIMLIISGKDFNQYAMNPLMPSLPFHFENYAVAWEVMARSFANNLIIIGVSTIAILLFGSLTAYALARYVFPGRQILFFFILGVLAIPSAVIMVPTFMLVVQLGVLNTLWAVILPYAAHQSFVIFVLITFFSTLPEDMFESARLDGAGHLQIYSRIVIPLSWPILSAMAIFEVWFHWNDYAWPALVLSNTDLQTVAQKLVAFTDAQINVRPEPGQAMAASVIASLPLVILFIFSMRTFIAGLTSGAVKM